MAFRLLHDAQGHHHDGRATIWEVLSFNEDEFTTMSLRTQTHINRVVTRKGRVIVVTHQETNSATFTSTTPRPSLSCLQVPVLLMHSTSRAAPAFHLLLSIYAKRTGLPHCPGASSIAVFAINLRLQTFSWTVRAIYLDLSAAVTLTEVASREGPTSIGAGGTSHHSLSIWSDSTPSGSGITV